MSLEDKLRTIFRKDIAEKEAEYKNLICDLIARQDSKGILQVVDYLVNKEGNEQNGRTYTTPIVLDFIITQVGREIPENADESKYFSLPSQLEIAQAMVEAIRKKQDDFPTQLMHAIRLLSECYQGQEDYKRAAQALNSFKFDEYRSQVQATPEDKLRWWVDATQFFILAKESGSASLTIKKAHVFLNDVDKRACEKLIVEFKTCYAQVMDSERNFIGAAREYFRLSQMYGQLPEANLTEALKLAVTCAILAPAGPDRTRILASLYADVRSSQLANFGMLEKVFKERIIRPPEVQKFEALLQPHQNALVAGSQTVLTKAITEHNMLAASKLYLNITFEQLGGLLGISAAKAEDLARKMIERKQIEGTIDQVQGIIDFSSDRAGSLQAWDKQINNLCTTVNDVLESISRKHPLYKY